MDINKEKNADFTKYTTYRHERISVEISMIHDFLLNLFILHDVSSLQHLMIPPRVSKYQESKEQMS